MATNVPIVTIRDKVLNDDPLDFKTPGSVLTSTPHRIPKDFNITADSYISLCSRVYAAFCSLESDFTDRMPESVFQYYAILHLWKRMTGISSGPANTASIFCAEITLWRKSTYEMPIPLRTYLRGIGHFQDLNDYDRQFVLPVLPTSEEIGGVTYTLGKVSAETHSFYEAFPAPGIAALRILADIKYTENKCEERHWPVSHTSFAHDVYLNGKISAHSRDLVLQ